jgi:signal transduction histidine kinase
MHGRFRGPIRRSRDARVVAGVCGGLSQAVGIDVTIVRIGFVLLSLGSGVGILVYALAWLFVPLEGETTTIFSRAVTDRRGIRLVIAIIPALVLVQIVAAALHIGYLGSFSWPVFLAGGAAILIRRNASQEERVWINDDLVPMFRTGGERRTRWPLVVRIAVGLLLGLAGLAVLLLGHPTSAALRPVGGALLVIAAIVVVFGPWWLSLVRDLMSERQARAMAEERAQMAAHVHDSVLQTLALIQRSADDPQHVTRLARAQERELRSWLFEGRPPGTIGETATTLTEGIGILQRQVEADHGINVQVVVVGDCRLGDGLRALLDATREALVNAAKWSGAPQVSLYAEVEPHAVMLFVRDRGHGFDPDSVPDDRQGIAQSIRGRMARFGGSVVIRSSLGQGAEVELSMPRRELVR